METKRKVGRPKVSERAKPIIRPVSFKQEELWMLEQLEEKSYKPFSFSYVVKRLIIDYIEGRRDLPFEPYMPNIPYEQSFVKPVEQKSEADYAFKQDDDVKGLDL